MVQRVWADHCTRYIDSNNNLNPSVECDKYCCGHCWYRYCCSDKNKRLTQEEQNECPERPVNGGKIGLIVGIAAAVVFAIICVCLIVCCVVPCCLCHKICKKQRHRGQAAVTNTVASMPQPPYSPSGYPTPPSGYQPVSGQEGLAMPSAPPPSYMECTSPSYTPAPYIQGQPMYPLTPPNQPYAPQLPEEASQPPYNPSYGPPS
ncbi:PREDICTED: protein shisa-5-like [Cyprinodon variegatus]|uniref:protein shisa-5-like n=1 Tax=Cyprinodon variegatus TaxID=28743 RepID=UPI0007426D82|nr:PREDICTED: protein shisa-5-like [Cyprinodon variegatus]